MAENEALKADKAALEGVIAKFRVDPVNGTLPPPLAADEISKRNRAAAEQRKIDNLLAAGYSMERIEYLQQRAEELATQFRRTKTDRLNKGLKLLDPAMDMGLRDAADFALKDEIGDAEYERYLAAQKRPTTIGVSKVTKGSIADSVDIRPGDEIVTYDNVRVFNSGQLMGLTMVPQETDVPGELFPITVRRGGQVLQMMVPRGQLGISSGSTASIFRP